MKDRRKNLVLKIGCIYIPIILTVIGFIVIDNYLYKFLPFMVLTVLSITFHPYLSAGVLCILLKNDDFEFVCLKAKHWICYEDDNKNMKFLKYGKSSGRTLEYKVHHLMRQLTCSLDVETTNKKNKKIDRTLSILRVLFSISFTIFASLVSGIIGLLISISYFMTNFYVVRKFNLTRPFIPIDKSVSYDDNNFNKLFYHNNLETITFKFREYIPNNLKINDDKVMSYFIDDLLCCLHLFFIEDYARARMLIKATTDIFEEYEWFSNYVSIFYRLEDIMNLKEANIVVDKIYLTLLNTPIIHEGLRPTYLGLELLYEYYSNDGIVEEDLYRAFVESLNIKIFVAFNNEIKHQVSSTLNRVI